MLTRVTVSDDFRVSWLVRHTISLAVVVVALAAVGAVFAFARPSYHPSNGYTTVNMSGQRHYTIAQIKHVFASHSIRLASVGRTGNAKHGSTIFGQPWRGKLASAFTVTVFGAESTVMFGANLSRAYDVRLGNVSVGYGDTHPNQAFLARIKAAVADLQR